MVRLSQVSKYRKKSMRPVLSMAAVFVGSERVLVPLKVNLISNI